MRALVMRAFEAALAAVDARRATADRLRTRPIPGGVHLIAIGKAALAMAAGAIETCDVERGVVVAPFGVSSLPATIEVLFGAHPLPDADVGRRGEALLAFAASVPREATTLVLISGGGSALADVPTITAPDLADLTKRLLASGARIDELNAIRVALSRLKGGGLARAIRGAVRTLVVSDIVFGPASQVASGPMSRWRGPPPRDVAHRLAHELSLRELAMIEAWRPTRTHDAKLEVVADNARAVAAAIGALRDEGRVVGIGPALKGEARDCGRTWARVTRHARIDTLVAGGETTVTVRGQGRGGRNQEMALAALEAGITGSLLCAGTDGVDGPTDAAGALVGPTTIDAGEMRRALETNDSYGVLRSAGALVLTGPTGTNVADIAVWAR